MADLEAVLADVSYLMAMEKSKCTPAARASKKIVLPDPTVRCVMIKYMERNGEINFDKIFNQRLGYLLFKDFCLNIVQEQVCIKCINFHQGIIYGGGDLYFFFYSLYFSVKKMFVYIPHYISIYASSTIYLLVFGFFCWHRLETLQNNVRHLFASNDHINLHNLLRCNFH